MITKRLLSTIVGFTACVFSTAVMAEFKCEDIKDKVTRTSCIADRNAKQPAEKDGQFGVFHTASSTCSGWLNEHSAMDPQFAYQQNHWLRGYLSGYAMGSEQNFLRTVSDRKELEVWISDYCKYHRDDGLLKAALALKDELLKRMQ